MRIGMMADVYKPHVSGITNYIDLNKRYLQESGYEVFVFTFSEESASDDEPNVIRSPGLPLLETGYYLSLRYTRQAVRLLHGMDVVHVHHPFLSGSLALRYCRSRGIPIVFTNHTRYDLYAQAYLPLVADVVGETAMRAYLPVFCRACDLVIAPSPGMRDILARFGVDAHVEVIPNGVELDRFRQNIVPLDRSQFGFTSSDVILVYTGRLGPEKNLPFLLRSFAGVVQAFDHARLLIVGDGPERDNLEDRAGHMGIRDKVHFAGMVSYDAMHRYLAMADAFVTASVTEVHPLSVIEAMAAGLPVLGIRSPGVGDMVVDGQTGYLVAQEDDLPAFTAKMVRLVTDEASRREMGERARRDAEQYDIRRTTQLMIAAYQQAMRRAQGRQRGWRARLARLWDRWE